MNRAQKAKIKKMIPPIILNNILLRFPALYKTRLVNYESNLECNGGLEDLLSQLALVTSIEGDVIECGSSRCGSSIIMANFLRSRQINKMVYALDSFEGFDSDEIKREREAGLTGATEKSFTSTSYEYVVYKISSLDLEKSVKPIKGYFQETMPKMVNHRFCFTLIDCDLQESLFYCAETIWPSLSKHARIVFDDYTDEKFLGAKIGVDRFLEKHSEEILEHGMLNRLYYVMKK